MALDALASPTLPRAPAGEMGTGESLLTELDDDRSEVDPTDAPRLPEVADLPSPEPLDEPPRARAVSRAGTFVDAVCDPGRVSAALEPVEPADPIVSANATGIAAAAEPTPKATANAPTRPT
jgi:hypothetical protein